MEQHPTQVDDSVQPHPAHVMDAEPSAPPRPADSPPPAEDSSSGVLSRIAERLGRRYGVTRVAELVKNRGSVTKTLGALPDRMHKVANQTQLIFELVDDYRTGTYREIPWRSLLVLVGIVAYVLSPIDLIPDMLSAVGVLDDMVLIAFADRFIRHDLKAYCQFKGYAPDKFF